jgi:hypothetical protein
MKINCLNFVYFVLLRHLLSIIVEIILYSVLNYKMRVFYILFL